VQVVVAVVAVVAASALVFQHQGLARYHHQVLLLA
jgi:hypothetical protein